MLSFNNKFPVYAQDDYDSYFLIKFVDNELFQKKFLDGKLYMKSPMEFHDEKMGEGRSDVTEGSGLIVNPNDDHYAEVKFIEKDGHAYIRVEEYKERPENYPGHNYFSLYPVSNQNSNVFCIYTLWLNSKTQSFTTINTEMLGNFGEYGIIITDTSEFLNRIGKAVIKNKDILKATAGFVNYIPHDSSGVFDWNPFTKYKQGYDYQNEFRVCFEKNYKGTINFDLGCSLRDITIPIRTSRFINTLRYQDGNIYFAQD